MKPNHIYQGDALSTLKTFPDESINCVMTSPPYWALRDYGIKGQVGLEKTFEEHITNMCDIFDEVKRVLRKDGTCWVNYGDTFASSGGVSNPAPDRAGGKAKGTRGTQPSAIAKGGVNRPPVNLPTKSLGMIPFRFAIEMVNRGWILRNTIIWHKPNPMPSSAKDRFTVDFEYLFFFSKSKKYWFEQQFEKQDDKKLAYRKSQNDTKSEGIYKRGMDKLVDLPFGRNKRTVWKIPTQPFPEAHFAVYPEKLCITPIKAGCPEGGIVLDPFMGAGTTAVVARKLGRDYVGIELSKEYIKIAEKRLQQQRLI